MYRPCRDELGCCCCVSKALVESSLAPKAKTYGRLGESGMTSAESQPSAVSAVLLGRRGQHHGSLARKEERAFYLVISPWMIGFLLFIAFPFFASFYFSLTKYDAIKAPQFVGLANWKHLFEDRIFYRALGVTTYYTFFRVPVVLAASLALAVLLNQDIPLLSVFRTIYYLPSVVTGVAVALLFMWILNPQIGIVNYLIAVLVGPHGLIPLGIKGPGWFFSEYWVIPSLVIMSLWGLGGPMLIYLASLQNVPTQLYEAAIMDGAGAWTKFWRITIPMISPVLLFTFVTNIIGSFQVFTQAYIVSNGTGGPNYASMFYVLYLFLEAFQSYRIGYGAALAWMLFLIILGLTLLTLRLSRDLVYYESPV
jgi:multiple sugar transport system permease protein